MSSKICFKAVFLLILMVASLAYGTDLDFDVDNDSKIDDTFLDFSHDITGAVECDGAGDCTQAEYEDLSNYNALDPDYLSGDTTDDNKVDAAIVASDLAISGGTINNSTIGATTASTGKFTTLTVREGASDSSSIILHEDTDNGENTIELKAPTTLAGDVTLTLPVDDGDANEYLQTNGSGTLTWAAGTAGNPDPIRAELYGASTSDEFVLWKNTTGGAVDVTGLYCYLAGANGATVDWKLWACDNANLNIPLDASALEGSYCDQIDIDGADSALQCAGGEDSDVAIAGNKDILDGDVLVFEISATSGTVGHCTFITTVQ